MAQNQQKYMACTAEYYAEDDDENSDKAVYASKFTQLLLAVCSNYDTIFITPHNNEISAKLCELLQIGARSKNLNLVV